GQADVIVKMVVKGRSTDAQERIFNNCADQVPIRLKGLDRGVDVRAALRAMAAATEDVMARAVPFWHLTKEHFPGQYLAQLGIAPLELNVFVRRPSPYVSPSLTIERIGSGGQQLNAWAQYE